MKNPYKLARYMPIAAWLEQSKAFGRDVGGRHDVPTHVEGYDEDGNPMLDNNGTPVMVPVMPDLRDIKGRWWGAKDGRSLASVVLIESLRQGGQSAITPVLMALITVLTVVAMTSLKLAGMSEHELLADVFHAMGSLAVVGAFVLFIALWTAIGAHGNRTVLLGSVVVPAAGILMGFVHGVAGAVMAHLLPAAIVLGVAAFLVFMFIGDRDTSKQIFYNTFKNMAFFAITAGIAYFAVGKIFNGVLLPLYWAILGCSMPVWWERKEERMRSLKLDYQELTASGDSA